MQVSQAEVGRNKNSQGPAAAVFVGSHKAAEGSSGRDRARGPAVPVHAEVIDDSSDEEGEEEDEYDPVVKRLPVFFNSNPDFSLPAHAHFNPTLDEDGMELDGEASNSAQASRGKNHPSLGPLALLQYPHRPRDLSTSHPLVPPSLRPGPGAIASGRIMARYKPGVRHLALDVPLEVRQGTDEERFNDERARHFARGLPQSQKASSKGKRPARGHDFDDDDDPDPLSRITLSSQSVPEQTHYVVGIRRDDEIHLVPLAQTLQLRPSLEYLDRLKELSAQENRAARRRAGQEADSSEDEEGGGDADGENGAKKAKKKDGPDTSRAIQVSIASAGVERGSARGGASLFAPLRAAEAESWVSLSHFHSETRESGAIREKMLCSKTDNELHPISTWQDLLKL